MTTDERVLALADIVSTLIAWIAQTAGAPLSLADAKALMLRLDKLRDNDDQN